jgi:GT2 family glycosyltransferase
MNQALKAGSGDFLVQLNPDTHILYGALDKMVELMRSYPEVGICGPKMLNRDRSFQQQCRRGDPRPWAVISYFLRLYKLFPKSKFFGGYLLNYLGEDQAHCG